MTVARPRRGGGRAFTLLSFFYFILNSIFCFFLVFAVSFPRLPGVERRKGCGLFKKREVDWPTLAFGGLCSGVRSLFPGRVGAWLAEGAESLSTSHWRNEDLPVPGTVSPPEGRGTLRKMRCINVYPIITCISGF